MNKKELLDMVRAYYEENHKKPYLPSDKINYAGRVYDSDEMVNLVDSALDFWLTSGSYCEQFEDKLAEFLGVRYCHMVNSGSSANLLAFMALTSPMLGDRTINRGDEIITVAAAFPTTVAPILQYGAIPVFVDITIPCYNIDISLMEKAISPKTKAVFIAHTLGNPFNLQRVVAFCRANNLWLIEDNCDALGSEYADRKTGSFGDIGTSSFYPPHHITTGEGGAVYTNDSLLNKIMLSMRDWGRDCVCPSGKDNVCKNRFIGQHGNLPYGYDHKYVYSHFGYNLKATEMQAAIGLAQLDKLDEFTQKRRENWRYLHKGLNGIEAILPENEPLSQPSPFGFILTCKKERIAAQVESDGIQTRMLFGGNIVAQPCFAHLKEGIDYRISGKLENTDIVMNKSFWVGVYPGMNKDMLDRMIESIKRHTGVNL